MGASPGSAQVETLVDSGARPERYAGLATRVISFVVDAALITTVAIIIGIGAFLVQGVLHFPSGVQMVMEVIGAVAYVLGSIGYFAAFWSATGQTPGARVMQIRVLTATGDPLRPRRAVVRCFGVVLAALPLFAGFVPILFDRRRRGFQDWIAGTVVADAPQVSLAQSRRRQRRGRSAEATAALTSPRSSPISDR